MPVRYGKKSKIVQVVSEGKGQETKLSSTELLARLTKLVLYATRGFHARYFF